MAKGESGTAPRPRGAGDWKPLMDAAFAGDAKRIARLIDAGADPNIPSPTPGGHRPLHRAIEQKKISPRTARHEEAVRVLLQRGADPTLRGSWDKHTALQLAAISAPRFVPILVDHFKPFDIFHACCVLDEKRVTALLKHDRSLATAREVNGYTPLHYLAASRVGNVTSQLAIARKLIDAGADVNGKYNYQNGQWPISVLYFACGFNDNPELTEFLLEAGAIPYDNESIYHAADEGHDACLAVIEKHADQKKLAKEATLALRTQMHWGKSRGAQWLLSHGADPNSLYPQTGESALHAAARHGAGAKVIDLLLQHGADPTLKSRDGRTAIEIAKRAKKPRVIMQLSKP